jgi:hypothetical protein
MNLLVPFISAAYTSGIAYAIRATNLDRKVFDFTAPTLIQACAFGALTMFTSLLLQQAIIKVTHTNVKKGSELGMRYIDVKLDYPLLYKISKKLAPYISAFGCTYLLRQMNYSTLSYRFVPICNLPFLAYKLYKSS